MFQDITAKFWKIHLIEKCKSPQSKFSTKKGGEHTHVLNTSQSYGIVCGERNNITVIDLDTNKWDNFSEHPFIKEFGEDFIENFNTFTVKTVRGGYHLYFKYNPSIYQTQNGKLEIDVRSNGGYVVGPESYVEGIDSKTKEQYSGSYSVYRDCEIQEMPENLVNWMLDNIYNKTKEIILKEQKKIELKKDQESSIYKYDVSEKDIRMICETLIKKYPDYLEYFETWFKFTTFCKVLNIFDIWQEYSKKSAKYDKNKNMITWNTCDVNVNIVEHILTICGMSERIVYYKYKPVLKNTIEPSKIFDRQKLGYDFFKEGNNFVIKSDTGTGKTTSAKHYFKNIGQKFISIVSRESLGREQYDVFIKEGLDCDFYKCGYLYNGNSVVVCLDSIFMIQNLKYSNYVLFLDEFSSIIEHLFTSPTLGNKRIPVFYQFMDLIRKCKQIIAVDADINDICFKFLDYCGVNYVYQQNTYKHSQGVVATEWTNQEDLINHIKNLDKYLIACDSKKQADYLFQKLEDKNIKLYTSETTEHLNFDDAKKIIFSPKVIYGIDSTMRRPVFCFYKSHTISPKHMVQQINRCRDIEYLGYIFLNKNPTFKKGKMISVGENKEALFNDLNSSKQYINDVVNYDLETLKLVGDKKLVSFYNSILNYYNYQNDCYGTNKMLHFKRIIRERGFIDGNKYCKNASIENIDAKEMKLKQIENFNIEDPKYKRINDILCVPENVAHKYAEWFIDNNKLKEHFNICNYFFKGVESIKKEIKEIDDFKYNVILGDKNKMLFFQKMIDLYGGNIQTDNKQLILNDVVNNENAKKLESEYKTLFRYRGVALDFSKKENGMKTLMTVGKQLFGKNIFKTKRTTVNYKKVQYCFVNKNVLEKEQELFNWRNNIVYINTGNMFEC